MTGAVLVNGPVHVPPGAGDADVGFIDEPAIARAVTASSRRLDDERGEALHPPVDGDVINLDAAFGEQFFDISVRESVAEVPAHRQQDHVGREPETNKRRGSRTATTNHPGTLRPAPNPSTQQCPPTTPTPAASRAGRAASSWIRKSRHGMQP